MLFLVFLFSVSAVGLKQETIETSADIAISNQKIEWGIKRGDNHIQPDLGSENKRIIDKFEGISMGNSEKPYIFNF